MAQRNQVEIPQEKIDQQWEYIHRLSHLVSEKAAEKGRPLRAFTDTYGCQQNVADTQSVAGMLAEMGYGIVVEPDGAFFILVRYASICSPVNWLLKESSAKTPPSMAFLSI